MHCVSSQCVDIMSVSVIHTYLILGLVNLRMKGKIFLLTLLVPCFHLFESGFLRTLTHFQEHGMALEVLDAMHEQRHKASERWTEEVKVKLKL